jgi:hypothetical protein
MEALKMKQKMITILGFLLTMALLTGCNQDGEHVEQMMTKLEKAAELEAEFAAQQEPLGELEKQEQALYEEMKELGLGEIDQITELATEAATKADERKALIAKEYASIEAAREEFGGVPPLIGEIEDENLKMKATTLVEEWNNRSESYERLYNKYNETIELDKQFYEMYQREDLEMEEAQQIIEQINKNYEEILQLKDEFNQYTNNYNEAKIAFYKEANYEVQVADMQE